MSIDPLHKIIYMNQASPQEILKEKLSHIPILGNIINQKQMKKLEKAEKLLDKGIKHFNNQEFPLAEKCFIKYANCNPKGFYVLGKIYIDKKKEADQEKGIKYLMKAAKANHLESYLALAKIYEQKANQDKNYSGKTIKYYEKAEKLGSKEASLALGYIYLYGHLTEKNLDKALDSFGKAGCLRSGLAHKIYSWKSRELDSQEKYFYLAETFMDNIKLETEDSLKKLYTREAISYYELAGKAGCIQAYLRLSFIHFYGINIEKNTEKTIDSLEKAVKLGSSIAFSRLRTIYSRLADTHFEKGELRQAMNYYEKATAKHHP
ncbi:MAG: sel1 repeat family protein [Chlamydiales bacterium]|jgi:TPR repeat protein|nr:sel1 repeat family protein [Chlamydiales bacterium]